jgi:VWFA-related protein
MHVSMDWSPAPAAVHDTLQRLRSSGSTALYDAIVATLPLADNRHRERAAFLVISDGADTASDGKLRDVQSALNRSDVFVYAVAIDAPERRAINTSVDPVSLATITDQSGGRTETVQSTGALAGALGRIAEELNSQYVLGYSPPHRVDGQYHTIRVRIADHPEYRVQARRGYIATSDTDRGR